MKKIEKYTPCELATLATIVGILIAAKLNVNEQNVIGNFTLDVGQIILIIAAQAQNIEAQKKNQYGDNGDSNSKVDNKDLQKQIDEIRRYVENLEGGRSCIKN
ncbi:hypothetical protein LGK97_04840 [Clostridium sp. CS001]|uniref:hypothetical protein n=1 Tax=Clostridium sp. CS001 TaxID=2880648 RepID=UPI001CF2962E|nr:hypothetical protein [Clostridium sp. CS001]MCB2289094.1 hypothetical protein [Clostridium sp. CS001]